MNSKDRPEMTSGGSVLIRHGESTEWALPHGEECIEEITNHIERHLGPVKTVFHEILSDTVHIDVHFVPPSPLYPWVRLVTSGMSDLPMHLPEGEDLPKYLELIITLPGDWKLDDESLKDERWYWPVRLIKFLARLPHKYSTWLGWGHTIPNGDPAEAYDESVKFSGAIILPAVSVSPDFHTLRISEDKTIAFLSVIPLFPGEMSLKLLSGTDELLDRFDKRGIGDVVDIGRKDVSKRSFWSFS